MPDGFGQPLNPSLLGPVQAEQVAPAEQAPKGVGITPLQAWLLTIGAGFLGAAGRGGEGVQNIMKIREKAEARSSMGQAMQALSNIGRLEREGRLDEAAELAGQWAVESADMSPTLAVQFRQRADAINTRRQKVGQTEAALTGIQRAVAPGARGPVPLEELVPPSVAPEVAAAQQFPEGVETPGQLLAAVRRAITPGAEGLKPSERIKLSESDKLYLVSQFPGAPRDITFLDDPRITPQIADSIRASRAEQLGVQALSQGMARGDVTVFDASGQPVAQPDLGKVQRREGQFAVDRAVADNINDLNQVESDISIMKSLARRVLANVPGQNLTNGILLLAQRGLASSQELSLFRGLRDQLVLRLTRAAQGARASDMDLKFAAEIAPSIWTDRVDTAIAKLNYLEEQTKGSRAGKLGQPYNRPKDFSTFITAEPARRRGRFE